MDYEIRKINKMTSDFLNIDQISAIFKILEKNILTSKKLIDKGIFSNSFLHKLSDHNDKHKIDIKQTLEERKFNFRVDENNNFNFIGYPRGNFIFLFTYNFVICLKAKSFIYKYFPTPIFKV